jgi:thiamine-phosphate pyrophosphorylase
MNPAICYVTDRKSLAVPAGVDPIAMLLEKIRAAADAGADWVQIREKDLPGARLLRLVRDAIAAAKQASETRGGNQTQIFVNDRLDVAVAAGTAGLPAAAGVHLGGESLPAADVVRWCRAGNAPADFQIGVSCHGVEAAREAERADASYIFFGPVFDTPSKRSFGRPQGLERLREVCRALKIPVIAIGGVNETNAEECLRAGASGVAAIRLFQDATDRVKLRDVVSALRGIRR